MSELQSKLKKQQFDVDVQDENIDQGFDGNFSKCLLAVESYTCIVLCKSDIGMGV
jgi:hypothetical protein